MSVVSRKIAARVAFKPLRYGHPSGLGPSGDGPITFAHCGGGNLSGGAPPRKEFIEDANGEFVLLQNSFGWDALSREDGGHWESANRASRRFWRIRAKGAPLNDRVGRPRHDAEKEQQARELLAGGMGVRRVAREVGTGTSFVQRIKREMQLEQMAEVPK